MPNIFEYTDYRKYLGDYYEENKAKSKSFSYNTLSLKAGFKNKAFLYLVIHGKKNLSKISIVKLSQAIGHNNNEAEYFENLVFFNKAYNLKERNYFYDKLDAVKCKDSKVKKVHQTRKDQYEFYSKWYHSAIRSLIDMYPFKDDYKWLAKNVNPPIKAGQAKKSVELLEKLGLIKKQKSGVYKLAYKSITTGNEIKSLAALNFHKEATDLAKNALETLPKAKRNITGLTVGVSEDTYKRICEEIKAFRSRIVQMVDQDKEADRTYQLNFHFFPITNTDIKR